ncbi:carbohydrate ABC transporter permease [Kribbella sp. NPDC058693]|uniref:Carbohydrate ABC transporter permease n=1 Tax=Kribbella jiaozuonensis TaxID=2575441 RepID=A0A4U3M3G4_9ACTN|nr:carbohydrate ABC transporter permease [Kribbella jiaozuonensis]TKK82752.1 carbohydrate ABC transporter permease [Kribbella jiaozuonensis]
MSSAAVTTGRSARSISPAKVLLVVVLAVAGFLMVVPFIWMILTSFKNLNEVNGFSWLPDRIEWRNYVDALKAAPFLTYFRNSIIVVVGQTIPVLAFCTAAGYALAQLPIRGRKGILNYFIVLLIVPFQVLIVPLFLVVRRIPLAGGNDILGNGGTGWLNTWAALIVPFVSAPLYTFLARQFFVSLPAELADAARVDGVSEIGIFFRIMAPLAAPAFVTITLFNVESAWNGFIWPLVATSSESLRPLQFGLATFAQGQGNVQWPFLMAMSALATLPMILLFVLGQRYFIAGMATSGIKG